MNALVERLKTASKERQQIKAQTLASTLDRLLAGSMTADEALAAVEPIGLTVEDLYAGLMQRKTDAEREAHNATENVRLARRSVDTAKLNVGIVEADINRTFSKEQKVQWAAVDLVRAQQVLADREADVLQAINLERAASERYGKILLTLQFAR